MRCSRRSGARWNSRHGDLLWPETLPKWAGGESVDDYRYQAHQRAPHHRIVGRRASRPARGGARRRQGAGDALDHADSLVEVDGTLPNLDVALRMLPAIETGRFVCEPAAIQIRENREARIDDENPHLRAVLADPESHPSDNVAEYRAALATNEREIALMEAVLERTSEEMRRDAHGAANPAAGRFEAEEAAFWEPIALAATERIQHVSADHPQIG